MLTGTGKWGSTAKEDTDAKDEFMTTVILSEINQNQRKRGSNEVTYAGHDVRKTRLR